MAKLNVNPPQPTQQDINRFWRKVDKTPGHGPKGDCWKWTTGTLNGYGNFCLYHAPPNETKRTVTAHRLSFFLATGIWSLLYICHHCDWRLCCNPAHLFEGTAKANRDDCAAKSRDARGEKVGTSKLTASQVLEIRALRHKGIKQRIIAEQFGIDCSHVSLICGKRKSWSHI
jgi:hypothetical protein